MEVILSAAVSLDGYLDDCSPRRLKLSGEEDWDAVQRLRAACDAILVGAGTIRRDNPSLVIRDPELRARRAAEGLEADIVKVTLTATGDLDPAADFFTEGAGHKIVFASHSADRKNLHALEKCAEVVMAERITSRFIVETLEARDYRRLMVEGGSAVHTMFLAEGAADRLRLAVAPFFVGNGAAPRFVGNGVFPWNKNNRATLESIEMLGDTAVLNYKFCR